MKSLFLRAIGLLSGLALLTACGADKRPNVILETQKGLIEIEVHEDSAPISARDFLYYVDEGLYDGQGFYRAVRPENDPLKMGMSILQGGRLDLLPVTPDVDHETQTGLSNIAGTVSLARDRPGTGSAAYFFINTADNPFLDFGGKRNPDGQGYASFGTVVKGMEVVRAIQSGATVPQSDDSVRAQFLVKPVIIHKAYRK